MEENACILSHAREIGSPGNFTYRPQVGSVENLEMGRLDIKTDMDSLARQNTDQSDTSTMLIIYFARFHTGFYVSDQ